jgi:gamma-glutamylcyclotransferase (GGCT)/AIG2-like uncharacterized protein YtfP
LFRGGNGGAVATIEPKRGGCVPALLWRISPDDEARLDHYEGYPHLYRKEKIRVRHDEKWITAMVYVMNEGYSLGLPSEYYLKTILEGYMEFSFDSAILCNAIEQSAPRISRTL